MKIFYGLVGLLDKIFELVLTKINNFKYFKNNYV